MLKFRILTIIEIFFLVFSIKKVIFLNNEIEIRIRIL